MSESYELMKEVYADDCRTQVYTWISQFKNGGENLNDDQRPGRPEASNMADMGGKSL